MFRRAPAAGSGHEHHGVFAVQCPLRRIRRIKKPKSKPIITLKGGGLVAIYYCDVCVISRGKGQSAVAAAAYRSAEKLRSEIDGKTKNYREKTGVVFTDIITPMGFNLPRLRQRETLWNEVERVERRVDARLAREFKFALPAELNRSEHKKIIRDFCKSLTEHGLICDVALHDKGDGNPHVHVMATLRAIQSDGTWAKKIDRELNSKAQLEKWKIAWCDAVNTKLREHGIEEITYKSYADQGSKKIGQVHLGPAATALEKRGIRTEVGDQNRAIREHNAIVEQIELAQREHEALVATKEREIETVIDAAAQEMIESAGAQLAVAITDNNREAERSDSAVTSEDAEHDIMQLIRDGDAEAAERAAARRTSDATERAAEQEREDRKAERRDRDDERERLVAAEAQRRAEERERREREEQERARRKAEAARRARSKTTRERDDDGWSR